MVTALIHDCDPGLDDAAALLMALGAPDRLDVRAVTAVAGNVPLAATFQNARGLLALAGREDIACHAGCDRSLMTEPLFAEQVHGKNGIGGVTLPVPAGPASEKHAVDVIVDLCRAAAAKGEALTLVVTGPMTNIAAALIVAPDLLEGVDELVFMGGVATQPGNVTPHAEFNFAVDPHAAQIVLERVQGKVPVVMMGLDVTRQVPLSDERLDRIRQIGSPQALMLADMLKGYRDSGVDADRVLHDPCTIAYLLEPSLFTFEAARLRVETSNEAEFGKSLAEWHADGPTRVATGVDDEAFYQLLTSRISAL